MKTIEDIILKFVFTDRLWSVNHVTDCGCLVAKPKDEKIHDYWTICSNFDLEKQAELFQRLMKQDDVEPGFQKNISLLYVKEVDNIDLSKVDPSIIAVENDPYFFKKYVLTYTQQACDGLYGLLTNQFSSMTLPDIALSSNCFNHFREENSFGPYHLLYSIAHKIPFLKFAIQPKDYDAIGTFQIEKEEDKFLLGQIEPVTQNNAVDVMKQLIENTDDDEDIKA